MCTAHPAENVNYVFKGRQGALAVFGSVWRRSPREEMLKSLTSLGCQLSVWLWEGKGPERQLRCSFGWERVFLPVVPMMTHFTGSALPISFSVPLPEPSPNPLPTGRPLPSYPLELTPSMAPLHSHTQIGPTHIQRQFSDATVNVVMCIVFDSGIAILGMFPPIVIFP